MAGRDRAPAHPRLSGRVRARVPDLIRRSSRDELHRRGRVRDRAEADLRPDSFRSRAVDRRGRDALDADNRCAPADGLPCAEASVVSEQHRLELIGLHKAFGEVKAVNGIDLAVEPGEFLTLLGPSGAGKTMTLKMIAGFEQPSAGRGVIDGRDVSSLSPAARQVGVVFQHYALFPHMTVAENV